MDTETGQGFIRQRRNLISISIILFLYQVLGVEFKTFNIFGTTGTIQNSSYVALILWIICLYFLLRYYQYYKHIDIKEVKNGIKERMYKYSRETAFKILQQTYDPLKSGAGGIQSPHKIIFNSMIIPDILLDHLPDSIPKEWTFHFEINVSGILSSGAIRQSGNMPYSITVNRKKLIWPILKSLTNLAFTTKFVTEYYLPFVLAYFSIVIQIYLWTNDFIRR